MPAEDERNVALAPQSQEQQIQQQQQGHGPVLLGRTSSHISSSSHISKTSSHISKTSSHISSSSQISSSSSHISYCRQVSKPLPTLLSRLSSCLGMGMMQVGSRKEEDEDEDDDVAKIRIDKSTEVPEELYFALVEAGRKARMRGQHRKAGRKNTARSIVLSPE